MDPIAPSFPWLSPYAYAEDNPVNYEDIEGLKGGGPAQAKTTRTTPRTGNRASSGQALSTSYVDKNGKLVMAPFIGPNNPPRAPYGGDVARLVQGGGWIVTTNSGASYIVRDTNPFGSQPPRQLTAEEQMAKEAAVLTDQFKRNINADKQTQISIPELPISKVKDENNETEPEFIYRAGANTDLNFTPRPGKDDGTGAKSGLSAFTTPLQATQGKGGKVQILSVKILKELGFVITVTPDGHVGIRPRTQQELKEWAASRPKLETGGNAHNKTQAVKATRIGEVKVP